MGTGYTQVMTLPEVKEDIQNQPIYERAEIEHPLDDVVTREMVYVIGREEVSEDVSPQRFRLHFFRRSDSDNEPIKDSYDFTRKPVTNYEPLKKE